MEQTVNLPLLASVVRICHHQLSGQFHSQRTQADSKMGNAVNILPLVRLRRCESCLTNSHNLSPFSWGEKVNCLSNKTLGILANPPQHFLQIRFFNTYIQWCSITSERTRKRMARESRPFFVYVLFFLQGRYKKFFKTPNFWKTFLGIFFLKKVGNLFGGLIIISYL